MHCKTAPPWEMPCGLDHPVGMTIASISEGGGRRSLTEGVALRLKLCRRLKKYSDACRCLTGGVGQVAKQTAFDGVQYPRQNCHRRLPVGATDPIFARRRLPTRRLKNHHADKNNYRRAATVHLTCTVTVRESSFSNASRPAGGAL